MVFTRTVRPEEPEDLALGDVEAHSSQRLDVSVGLRELRDLDRVCHGRRRYARGGGRVPRCRLTASSWSTSSRTRHSPATNSRSSPTLAASSPRRCRRSRSRSGSRRRRRPAGRGGRHCSRADLQPGPRDAVRWTSGARDGLGAGTAAPARRRGARDGIRDRPGRDRSGRVRARSSSDGCSSRSRRSSR